MLFETDGHAVCGKLRHFTFADDQSFFYDGLNFFYLFRFSILLSNVFYARLWMKLTLHLSTRPHGFLQR